MKREIIIDILRKAIEDEERLDVEFHVGRVSALRFALSLLEDDDDTQSDG
jgi:hypothetical protein